MRRILVLRAGFLEGVLVLGALVLSACGGTAPSAATPTTVPATPTPIPPTDTPVAATIATGGGAGASSPFGAALEKAKTATSYRVDMQVRGKGNFGLGSAETPAPDATPIVPADQEITLIAMQGQVNGQSTHFTLQGLFAAFLGIDPTKSLEVITVGDKSYIHGPIALLGATEDKWYELPPDQSSIAKPPLTPDTFLSSLTSAGLSPSDFQKTGTESLDSHSCDVYSADRAAIEQAFKKLGQTTGTGDLSSIDSAEFKSWICDDGFVHQIRMAVEGHTQDKPDQKGSFLMLMHISDIGANIAIEAPPNPEPLSTPSLPSKASPTP